MTAEDHQPLSSAIATLFPGYFALVMATGIIAVAASQQGLTAVAYALFWIALLGFAILAVLNVARVARFPKLVARDLTHHRTGFSFLTLVAAMNVLGGGAALIYQWWSFSWVIWIASCACWLGLLYTAVVSVIIDEEKPDLAAGINGTWFLLTVSTESIAVVGALLLGHVGEPNEVIELVSLAAFTLGIVLYLIVATLLFLRWTFRALSPEELQPPSWIAAGAVAITVLAGSNLLGVAQVSPRIERLGPFIEGMVVMAWATATFWFPVMVAIGIWRHIVRRFPLRYEPAYWSLVFPIGMYSAATFKMIAVTGLDVLDLWPQLALGAALVVWAAAMAGLLAKLARVVTPSSKNGE